MDIDLNIDTHKGSVSISGTDETSLKVNCSTFATLREFLKKRTLLQDALQLWYGIPEDWPELEIRVGERPVVNLRGGKITGGRRLLFAWHYLRAILGV